MGLFPSVSFRGTYIDFPQMMKPGKEAIHTWMVSDIDLPKAIEANDFTEESVELIVRCCAEIAGETAAVSETVVPLT